MALDNSSPPIIGAAARQWPHFVWALVVNGPLLLFVSCYRPSSDNQYITYRLPVLGAFPVGVLFDLTLLLILMLVWLVARPHRWSRALFLVMTIPVFAFVVLFRVVDHYYYASTKVPLNVFVLYGNLTMVEEGKGIVLDAPLALLAALAVCAHYTAYVASRRYAGLLGRSAERLSAPGTPPRAAVLGGGAVLLLLALNTHALVTHPRKWFTLRSLTGEYQFVAGLPRFFEQEALLTSPVAATPARFYLPSIGTGTAHTARPDIFIVTIESFNALYTLAPRELNAALTADIMPFFKSLGREPGGFLFSNTYTSSAYTFNGIVAVLCSQYTMSEIVWGHDCLPEVLRRQGYEPFSFISIAQLRPYRYDNFRAMGFDRERVFDAMRMRHGKQNVFYNFMVDKEVFSYAAAVADSFRQMKDGKPLFMHVSTNQMHVPGYFGATTCAPYRFPADLQVDALTRRMINSAHCTDRDLAQFVAHLKRSGLYDDALVVITADHAFNLSFWNHKESELAKVPLFVKFPKSGPVMTKVDTAQVSAHIDIVPTILDYLGLRSNRPMYGRSLLADSNDPARHIPGISSSRLMSLASQSGVVFHVAGKLDFGDRAANDELNALFETVLYFDQNPTKFEQTVRTAGAQARWSPGTSAGGGSAEDASHGAAGRQRTRIQTSRNEHAPQRTHAISR